MDKVYDVIVVGGGPGGLTAALYLARARCRVLVLEKDRLGGQIALTERVVNYPGVSAVSGAQLADTLAEQARAFGAELRQGQVVEMDLSGDVKHIRTAQEQFSCLGVLLATGAHPRTLGFAGEEAYRGRGVAYCATCDGEFFAGKDVFVVGGGYVAAEESVFLTRYARHVTVLIRKGDFSCAAAVAEPAKKHEKITVLTHTVLEEVSGGDAVTCLRYKNTETGAVTEVKSPPGESLGVFVFCGYAPETDLVRDLVELDAQGYIVTDREGRTRLPGVFGAGDVCAKALRQVVTATGDGAVAAGALEKYTAGLRDKLGIPQWEPPEPEPSAESPKGTLTPALGAQLRELFSKMKKPLGLELHLDQGEVSGELKAMMEELAALTDKLRLSSREEQGAEVPYVLVTDQDGGDTGLGFHGVPGGHEFTAFVLGLYQAAGPGQPLEAAQKERLRAISGPVDIKILVSLSCTLCPETVISAQKLAVESPHIRAHVYDIRHFPALREQYHVMSVPCIVINDSQVYFGKKNVEELLALISALP